MKNATLVLILLLLSVITSCNEKKEDGIIEVPIEIVDELGPFEADWTELRAREIDDEDFKFMHKLSIKKLPDGLSDIRIDYVSLEDIHPGVFPFNLLEKEHLNSLLPVVYGRNKSGEVKMVVDANRNGDMTDDAVFAPLLFNSTSKVSNDSLMQHAILVQHQKRENGRLIDVKVSFLVVYLKDLNLFIAATPQYGIAEFGGEKIGIHSTHKLSYDEVDICLYQDTTELIAKQDLVGAEGYIIIGDTIYQNKGVDKQKKILRLKKIGVQEGELYSSQIGYKAFPFEGENFLTAEPISLEAYKGKYLFIDFWSTWCKPCLEEMPELKKLYETLDKEKIDFLGIVGSSKKENLEKLLSKNKDIIWPQLFSDDENKIIETYGISSYPTTLLINPEGIVVAKNLREKEVEEKIRELGLLQ